jgi:hypothetical protein
MSGEKKSDLVQVGVSQESRNVLESLQEAGYIADLMDGFRLAIATAIGFGREPRERVDSDRKTTFAVGNLDPDSALREAIKEIYPAFRATPARAAEDLAEQGLEIAKESFNGEEFSFSDIIERVKKANA